MQTDGRLICALLRKLAEIEKTAADGRAVQAAMDRSVADPITVDGYGWEAIFFKRLTDKGHGVLTDCNARPPEQIGFLHF
jgi:hypothetical protein